jgi:hypothetical protein
MVDLHVAHCQQGGQHGLDDLLPVQHYSNAMNTNLQCGHAARRWICPHYVLTGGHGGEGDRHLGHGQQDGIVTEQLPGLVPGTSQPKIASLLVLEWSAKMTDKPLCTKSRTSWWDISHLAKQLFSPS